MTTTQADRLIKSGKCVKVYDTFYRETFARVFIRRDRWNIYTLDGHVYDRGQLDIVKLKELK